MSFKRIIARLDIKNHNVIKGIQMDGLRVIGPAQELAKRYYLDGADELIMMDVVASLYGREAIAEIIRDVTTQCFIPITVGGGIRSLADADLLFRAGADKVAVNTGANARPSLITEIAEKYGSQAVIVHIDAKKSESGGWEAYTESGRNSTGIDVCDWIPKAIDHGAGEVLVTSVDQDGTRKGLNRDLLTTVGRLVSVPLVLSGGTTDAADAAGVLELNETDGIAVGAALHYRTTTVPDIREKCRELGVNVRELVA